MFNQASTTHQKLLILAGSNTVPICCLACKYCIAWNGGKEKPGKTWSNSPKLHPSKTFSPHVMIQTGGNSLLIHVQGNLTLQSVLFEQCMVFLGGTACHDVLHNLSIVKEIAEIWGYLSRSRHVGKILSAAPVFQVTSYKKVTLLGSPPQQQCWWINCWKGEAPVNTKR